MVSASSRRNLRHPAASPATTGRRDAEADAWQRITLVETSARSGAAVAPTFGLELGNAEYCIAQVQSHIQTGMGDINRDHTLDMVSTLANWENGLSRFDAEIDSKLKAMTAFGEAAQSYEVLSVDDLERDVWRAWMSTLDNTTDEALDHVIQRCLVRLGLIPDHIYMTDEDQHRAVAVARAQIAQASRIP